MSHVDLAEFSRGIRRESLKMAERARAAHIGGALSVADILAVLYGKVLTSYADQPRDPRRDRLFFSKGHCVLALYATLALRGFLPLSELEKYGQNGSNLLCHASHKVPGVELSTGSLGHALPVACGVALAGKLAQAPWRTFVVMSDGELDEGSNWEGFLFAAHHRLAKLTAIIDYNKIQSLGSTESVLALEPLSDKFKAFGWFVQEVDGHSHDQLVRALEVNVQAPKVIIAHTVKGKGVSFMEHQLLWHYRPPSSDELIQALKEVGE
jgi:transketolase